MQLVSCIGEPQEGAGERRQHRDDGDHYGDRLIKAEARTPDVIAKAVGCKCGGQHQACTPHKGRRSGPGANRIRCTGRRHHHDRLQHRECQPEQTKPDRHHDRHEPITTQQCQQSGDDQTRRDPDRRHARAARMNEQHRQRRKILITQVVLA